MGTDLELDRFEVDGVIVLTLPEEVDNRSALKLEGELIESINQERDRILLDLTELEEISSGGLRVLLTIGKRLDLEGGCLALCGLRPEIREVLEVARMTRDFCVLGSRREGLEFLERRAALDRRARLALELLRQRDAELGVGKARRPVRDGGRTVGIAAALLGEYAEKD